MKAASTCPSSSYVAHCAAMPCSICGNHVDVKMGEKSPCQHVFHQACIRQRLAHVRVCAVCNAPLDSKELVSTHGPTRRKRLKTRRKNERRRLLQRQSRLLKYKRE